MSIGQNHHFALREAADLPIDGKPELQFRKFLHHPP